MSSLLRRSRTFIKKALRSVAFLPVPMITISIAIGFGMYYLENRSEISNSTAEVFPGLAITSQDTARTILGMFIGGLITLTVFAVSQIMILLNEAANSYSPRLLPKLTGDRSLQFVMGFNLSTIILMIMVLLSIRDGDDYAIPNFSILLCVVLGVAALCLFVYFITAITKRVQVNNIIDSTARDSLRGLEREEKLGERGFGERHLPPDARDWYAIPAPLSGYVGTIDFSRLSKLAYQYGTRLFIGVNKGEFVPEGLALLQSEHKLTEDQTEELVKAISPIRGNFDDWYLPNLKQLTEIALKAMSPGINDPGTAIMVVDRQTEVLGKLMHIPLHNYYREEEEGGDIYIARHSYENILSGIMQDMRRYCKEDPIVVRRLFQMLYHLLQIAPSSASYDRYLYREIRALLRDVGPLTTNPHDRKILAGDLRYHRNQLRHGRRLVKAYS
jgi:uncharacterized membrane protein